MPDVRNDEPINSVVNDLFGFSFQASVIAKLVGGKDSQNHLSVGVSGSWGSGKTSLLNMVRELLEYQKKYSEFVSISKKLRHVRQVKDKVKIYKQMVPYRRFIRKVNDSEHLKEIPKIINEVKVIWFDPWFFGSEETVIKAFFYRIAKELVDEDRELSKLFLKLAVVMVGSPDLPESSSLPVVGDALKIINFGRNLINRMSGDDGSIMDFTDIKRKICERLKTNEFTYVDDEDDTIKKTRKRIVIIIDDLDRLQVDEALTMLKVIRLIIEFQNINVIVSYDEHTLSKTIDIKMNGFGREYISKMINNPTYMPVCETDNQNNKIVSLLFDDLLYENEPLINRIHREYWSEISTKPHKLPDDIQEIKNDILSIKVFQTICKSIQLSHRDVTRLSNTFRLNYNDKMNPIHFLAHILLYYLYFEEYKNCIKNDSDFLIYESDRFFKEDTLTKSYSDSDKNDFDNPTPKNEFISLKLAYMNDKGQSLKHTDVGLYNLLSTVTPDLDTLNRLTKGEPYPFGFCRSICLFKNEHLYYSFKPFDQWWNKKQTT